MSVQRPSESLGNYYTTINITRKEELCLEAKILKKIKKELLSFD